MNSSEITSKSIPFFKMHSLENDIIILDEAIGLSSDHIRNLCHRQRGIGCDQVMVLGKNSLQIWNQDGSSALACGNGTRCVIEYLTPDVGEKITLHGPVGPLTGWREPCGHVTVLQGHATIGVIAYHKEFKPVSHLCLTDYGLDKGIPVNIGNPHLVILSPPPDNFFEVAPRLACHPAFPDGVNVSFVSEQRTVKVWERGAGPTHGCASAACAVAAVLSEQFPLTLTLPGGPIVISSSNFGLAHTAKVHPICHGHWWLS